GQWALYMGHVTNVIAGVYVDLKSADQDGNVYRIVPKSKQKAALAFLGENVFTNQPWMSPPEVMSRLGQPTQPLSQRAANVVTSLLSNARLGRLAESEAFDAANAYPLAEFMSDVRGMVFNGASPDQHRRAVQRAFIERLGQIINPPPAPAAPTGG